MNHYDSLDELLKKALSSTQVPEEELNQKIKNRMKEKMVLKRARTKPTLRLVFITTTLIVTMSAAVFAMVKYLSADECAKHFEHPALAEAFKSEDAIKINESKTSGGHKITLLGIVSGKNLTLNDIDKERTYAAVAIEMLDGKMPDAQDEYYDKHSYFVSPLIKGHKPWQLQLCNRSTETVIDGVLYRLIDCEPVELFADKGVYLCVSSSTFYDNKAFSYNSETGEISVNPNYDGVNVLFDLPISKDKADPEKAQQFLKRLEEEATAPEEGKIELSAWEILEEDIDLETIDKTKTIEKDGIIYTITPEDIKDGKKYDIEVNDTKTGETYIESTEITDNGNKVVTTR